MRNAAWMIFFTFFFYSRANATVRMRHAVFFRKNAVRIAKRATFAHPFRGYQTFFISQP